MTNPETFAAPPVSQEGSEASRAVEPQLPAGPSPAANVDEAAAAIRQLQAENLRLYDRLLRTQAELENSRKRMRREKEDFREHANAELVRALLPSLDAFERSLKDRDPKVRDGFYKGIELIYGSLLQVLERAGLARICVGSA